MTSVCFPFVQMSTPNRAWTIALGLALCGGVFGATSASSLAATARPAPASIAPPLIAGEYRGAVGNQHLIVTLVQADDGTLSGKLTAPDQGNAVVAFDSVTYAGNVLHIALKAAGASYEGTRAETGDSFSGHVRTLTLESIGAP